MDFSNSSALPTAESQPFECWTHASEVLTQDKTTSLAVFIQRLVSRICKKTYAPAANEDIGKMVSLVRARAADELHSSLPHTLDKMHIPIYEDLCRQFGSKYLLRAVMALGDGAFEAAVAERLKAHLGASAEKPDSPVKRRFFKSASAVSPLRDVRSPESSQESRATLTKAEGHALWRRLLGTSES